MLCSYSYRLCTVGTRGPFQADTDDVKNFLRYCDKEILMWLQVTLRDGKKWHFDGAKKRWFEIKPRVWDGSVFP